MGKQVDETKKELEVKGQQETGSPAAGTPAGDEKPKKKGFFRSLGTVGKVVVGVVVTTVVVVAGVVVKAVIGGKDEEPEAAEETREDSEPAEE